MSNEIERILRTQPLVVLDGALATELARRGCDLNDPLWSARVLIEQPEMIRAVHADYFASGADCATTASYQATFEGFAERGLSAEEAERLIRLSVTLAIEARDAFWAVESNRVGRERPFVAGSIGPYGAMLHDGSEYRGDYTLTVDELVNFHRPRMRTLIEAGAELIACETIPNWTEAQALTRLITEFPGVVMWISFSAKDGEHISRGERLADCVAALDDHPQIASVGVNCTAPEYIRDLVRSAAKETAKPILTYPNSGEHYDAETKTWHGQSCADYTAQAREWFNAGAKVIGGCCRTTPEHIRELAASLRGSTPATY
jgi:homocysteine S-methyltransferase